MVLPSGEKLRPYQVEGSKFLIENFSALLADDMGLGKSIQVIMAMKVLFNKGQLLTSIVLCPKAVLSDWKNKISYWAFELRIQVIDGNKEKRKLQWNTQAHVFICTYETLNNDFETENTNVKTFDLAVFDEAQKIKNPDTKLCKAARKINAEYKWAMTGTPMENRVEELVCILETIQPTIFHLPMKTVSIFSDTRKNLKMQLTKDNVKNAYDKISKRRLKKILMDLPEGDDDKLPSKTSEVKHYELYEKQQLEYDKVLLEGKNKILALGEKATRITVLALITKLKQLCNFSSERESPKLDILKNDLEKIVANGDRALVFSQYVKTLEQIKPQLLEYNPLVYTGDLNTKQRENYVKSFQDTNNNQVMLLSLKAANAGITLTEASYVYHFDLWWNPATMAQATDRVHRIGQEKMVVEKILVAKNTIEEKIYQLLEKKKDLFKDVIDNFVEDSTISTTLTDEEIFGILGLSVPNKTKENTFEVSEKPEIKSVSKSEIKIIDGDFSKLTPIEFEEFVAKLFEKLGYFVSTTQKSYDGGIDIFVKRQTPTGFDNGIIQCKHKQDSTKSIGINVVRELYGTLQADKSLHRGILATNAKFSKECYNFIQGKTIELLDGVALRGLVEKMK